jgi:hypothetical protein
VRRRPAIAFAAVVVSAAVTATVAQATPAARSTGARLAGLAPATLEPALSRHEASVTSANWSGYVIPSRTPITGVYSRFTVPSAKLLPPGFSSSWVGIGGATSQSHEVIQAGTGSDTVDVGSPRYYAWWETYPANTEQVLLGCSGDRNCTVRPGDRMKVDIHAVGRNLWQITVVDSGHWVWRNVVSWRSTQSSAEWIFEAPTLLAVQSTAANVGRAYFGDYNTFTVGGRRHSIAYGHPVKVNMALPGIREATPSDLARNHYSFNVCTYTTTCPAPSR